MRSASIRFGAPAAALLGAAAVVVGVGGTAGAAPHPRAPSCRVLPRDNPWNQRVDGLPVEAGSGRMIGNMEPGTTAHAYFGSGTFAGGPIGIPITIVRGGQRRVPVRFQYRQESDRGPYPIPRKPRIEGGPRATGDRHVVVLNRSTCKVYELYDARPVRGGRSWRAASGAVFDLRTNRLRPHGWTSADAAGLPILPGLARYDEVARGSIDHALRVTAPRTRKAFVYPARHQDGESDSSALPPMGARVRLRADADLSRLGPQARIVAVALQRYGGLLSDNGAAWSFTGTPDPGWDDIDLHTLETLHGSDFEVVDTGSLPRPGANSR